MPYISKERKYAILRRRQPLTSGELNYAITLLINDYVVQQGKPQYKYMNDVIGALEGAKAEFQRRIVAPYEDARLKENGDVYPTHWLTTGETQ